MPNAQLHTRKLDVQLQDMLPVAALDAQCLLPGEETMGLSFTICAGDGQSLCSADYA